MGRITDWARGLALSLGAPGLYGLEIRLGKTRASRYHPGMSQVRVGMCGVVCAVICALVLTGSGVVRATLGEPARQVDQRAAPATHELPGRYELKLDITCSCGAWRRRPRLAAAEGVREL